MLRRHKAKTFERLYNIAYYHPLAEKLSPHSRHLWNMITGAASGFLHQLFIKNEDPDLDWFLKRHLRRLDPAKTLTVYYWMLLYWLRLVKEFGAPGHIDQNDKETEFLRLSGTADKLVTTIAASIGVPVPAPFSGSWMSDNPFDLALKLFDATHTLLGLTPDLTDRKAATFRLVASSKFVTVAESFYHSFLQGIIPSKSDITSQKHNGGSAMSWKRIELTIDQVISQESRTIMDQFAVIFTAAGAPWDAAIFSRSNFRTGGETIYFSPKAAQLMQAFIESGGATDCDKPGKEDLGLLVGDASAWELVE